MRAIILAFTLCGLGAPAFGQVADETDQMVEEPLVEAEAPTAESDMSSDVETSWLTEKLSLIQNALGEISPASMEMDAAPALQSFGTVETHCMDLLRAFGSGEMSNLSESVRDNTELRQSVDNLCYGARAVQAALNAPDRTASPDIQHLMSTAERALNLARDAG